MGRSRDNYSVPDMIQAALRRLIAAKGWQLWLQITCVLFFFIVILSRSSTMCVNFPLFMYLRSDACKVWEDSGSIDTTSLSWWQRACLLERDWETEDYKCRDTRLIGNWPVCFDKPYSPLRPGKPCVVYSFGIAYDFRFDDAMAYHNCTVYSFDPSMPEPDHKHGPLVYFKRMGLGAEDNDNFVPRMDSYTKPEDVWKIKKLSSIMKMLGHTFDSLSLVKMDVEGNEWAVLRNWLEEGILEKLPQVLIEWHIFSDNPPHSKYEEMYNDFMTFKKLGYRRFWMRNEGQNHRIFHMITQAETAYVNSKFQSNS